MADEVEFLRERYKPDMLWYADDVFTIHYRWFNQYADELKKRMPDSLVTFLITGRDIERHVLSSAAYPSIPIHAPRLLRWPFCRSALRSWGSVRRTLPVFGQ